MRLVPSDRNQNYSNNSLKSTCRLKWITDFLPESVDLKPWYANTRIYYMARIMVLQEYYWETRRILVETSTERAETQFYMLFELLEYIETTTATIWYK